MRLFREELAESLARDRSDSNRKLWAKRISDLDDLSILLDLLDAPHPVGMRFMWMMGEICALSPDLVFVHLPFLWGRRDDFAFPGFHRSLGRWMSLAGVPEELEGEVMDVLVEWAMDPQSDISVKSYANQVLLALVEKYPDMKGELRLVLESQLELHTPAFQSRVRKWLRRLA